MYPKTIFVQRLFTDVHYSTPKGRDYRTVDASILGVDSLIMVEVKKTRLKVLRTAIAGDLSSYKEDLKKIIYEAMIQILQNINDFKAGYLDEIYGFNAGQIKRYLPVIVVDERFPRFQILWKFALEEVGKLLPESIQYLNELQVIDIEELEEIEIKAKNGLSFEEILKNKNQDTWYRSESMRNFLYYEYPKLRNIPDEALEKRFQEFLKSQIIRLDGQEVWEQLRKSQNEK